MTALARTLKDLSSLHPGIARLLAQADADGAKPDRLFSDWLSGLDSSRLADAGLDAEQLRHQVEALVQQAGLLRHAEQTPLDSITILGGRDKAGLPEPLDLRIKVGDVLCIVGPTGSGKSRLLGDIECLAQGDTPSGRRVLVNGEPPDASWRFGSNRRLIAQLSQNMNFVVDLSVRDFLAMHAECRMVSSPETVVADVIACANDLAGERFGPDVSLTQLSGGQSRALMIADTALLSASPIVLIDEIENAGIDRRKALELLVAREKIVLVSTHDPILALMGGRRVVIRNGAVADVIATSYLERACLEELQKLDARMMDIRQRLRAGQRIEQERSDWAWTL
ncbi:MAG TPA: ATP-binding cassette domain-containing protein [Candidatus Sulfotelmatobacter sp.]|jgi:ABC-type lipoprotein export system ATPase subunit|nr:ATP-binding cassette domain-containing protein [Candidatus Sulfotelmatobacter sp.]